MNLSNYRYNRVGGIDADRELDSGEIVPYTLTQSEIDRLDELTIIATFAIDRSDLIASVRSELSKACENEIESGFTADVLFSNCNYRSCRDQQRTMLSAARRSGGGKIWMNESFTHHTQAQAEQVLEECEIHIENIRTKFADKVVYISDPSRTDAEIEACTWDSVEA